MKKKILALLLSSICVLGGTSVYADNTTITKDTDQSAEVSVSIDKPETWEVLVPKKITLNMSSDGSTAESTPQNIIVNGDLYGGKTLTLDIPATCTLHATKGTSNTLVAQVSNLNDTSKSFTSDILHNNKDSKYQFKLSASNIKAETWTGTMTVNISVK